MNDHLHLRLMHAIETRLLQARTPAEFEYWLNLLQRYCRRLNL